MPRRRSLPAMLTAGLAAAALTVSVGPAATAQPTSSAPAAKPAPLAAEEPGVSAQATGRAGLHSLRTSVTDENFYFVMADRFANGTTDNDEGGLTGDRLVTGFDPTSKGFYNGGDLLGLRSQIDYIRGLGTTSIWLTPSFKNKAVQLEDGPSAGYHGYWITDFTQIDPHLGTNDDLKALVEDAHKRGMKVYFDIITNHTADVIGYTEGARTAYVPKDVEPYRTASGTPFDDRDYAGTEDFPSLSATESFPYTPVVDAAEEDIKTPAWLNDETLYHNRGNTTYAGEDSTYGDFAGLDDLFTENATVVDGMIDIYKTWIRDMDIDGFRIDTMKHVNDEFWQKFGPEVLDYAHSLGKREFFMFGEVYDTTRPFTSQYTTRNKMQAVIDFPFQDAARNFASKGQPTDQLRTLFRNDDWYTDADSNVYQLPTFLGNHDMGRIGHFVSADNLGADEDELLSRDQLAHELMYFSRGNPVIYYGDEQGFTGTGGDQVARQTMFASQVPDYLDDELLGTTRTHAQDNFVKTHPLYTKISQLATLAKEHRALRDGAHQHRYSTGDAGIYAFSRLDRSDQVEYVVALNNSESTKSAEVPTYVRDGKFVRVYGETPQQLSSGSDRKLSLTVPPLSTVVYKSARPIAKSGAAPRISVDKPRPSVESNSRMLVAADVDSSSFNEVTFYAKVGNGSWRSIGTDDTKPYRVYHDISGLRTGRNVSYRAVVRDNGDHTRVSATRSTEAPEPKVMIEAPAEGADVFGTIQVRAVVDPERASHVVRIQRSVNGAAWQTVATDRSSPVYSYFEDLDEISVGTEIRYRARLRESSGNWVTSPVRSVTRTDYQPLVKSVTITGSVQSEIGCPDDWQPACAASHLTFDATDGLWKRTFTVGAGGIPAGTYVYKVAIDDSWTVSYGANGGGDDIPLVIPAGSTSVTFTWDQATKIASHTVE